MVGEKKAQKCSTEKQEMDVNDSAEKSANRWLQYALMFKLPHIKVSTLQQRPKNTDEGIAVANTVIQEMDHIQPDICSMWLVDKEGQNMVCVFSLTAPWWNEAESKVSILTLLGVLQAERAADFYLSTLNTVFFRASQQLCLQVLGWNSVSKFYIILVLSDLLV